MRTYAPRDITSKLVAQDTRPAWRPKPYSEGQAALIKTMMAERGITAETLVTVFPTRPTTFRDGTKVIEWLKDLPRTGTTDASLPRLSAGLRRARTEAEGGQARAQAYHYALRNEAGEVKFYRVRAGRKEGFYFLDVQASDDYYPVKNRTTKKAILDAINADRDAALALYGQELGRCGRCLRTLTSEYRKLGIGPVCIDK